MEVTLEARLYREFFRALSNQTRFSIVQLLRERPHYVNEMAERLGIEQSRISHNLACLLNCGFVEWDWNGKNKVYRLILTSSRSSPELRSTSSNTLPPWIAARR